MLQEAKWTHIVELLLWKQLQSHLSLPSVLRRGATLHVVNVYSVFIILQCTDCNAVKKAT